MPILALDTSGDQASMALRLADGRTEEEIHPSRNRGDGWLSGSAARLLAAAGCRVTDLGAMAVGIGPGSYTGIRIAVTFAKVFAHELGIPLVGVSGLCALAAGVRRAGAQVAVLEPGHATQAYAAVVGADEGGTRFLVAPALVDARDFLAGLAAGTIVTGREAARWTTLIEARGLIHVPHPSDRVAAATLAELAFSRLASGAPPDDPFTLEPLYLQPPGPERR